MSDVTPHLGLPLLAASQAQKHVTHNEALGLLDALVQLACLAKDLTAPPSSPAEGDRYLVVASNPGGAWAGLAGQVVRYADGVWTGTVPRAGFFAYVVDEADLYIFDGAAWTSFRRRLAGIQSVGRLGINTEADATNRLAVKADAALLSWDDITPGSGDMRITVNKKAAANDAGFVFQTGYSSRALFGTLANDDFTLKVSPDGAAFATALTASTRNGVDFLSAEASLASAATVDLGAAGTRKVAITGTSTITSFGTRANTERLIRFADALTLTHNATSLILPGGGNIVTAAGDTCLATSDASGNWRVRHYSPDVDSAPLSVSNPAVTAGAGTITAASCAVRYRRVGRRFVFVAIDITVTTNGTGSGSINTTLPIMAGGFQVYLFGREIAATGNRLQGIITQNAVTIFNAADNSYPAGNGYRLSLSGIYEAA